MSLRGRVVSAIETDGNYRVDIRLRGAQSVRRLDLSQAGQFHAKPNEPVFVGASHAPHGDAMRLLVDRHRATQLHQRGDMQQYPQRHEEGGNQHKREH